MCGRTACTLSKKQLQQCCAYQPPGNSKKLQPKWRQVDGSAEYRPGYNTPPGAFLPVLYCDPEDAKRRLRCISTMKWGLVPSWAPEDPADFTLHMSNARAETLMQKSSFSRLVANGRRCALVCSGFYEWARPPSGPKRPHFFHQRGRPPAVACPDDSGEPPGVLFLAGLYDVHRRRGHADLFSFTVVTVAASAEFASIHHRMPAILESEEQLRCWLHSDDPQKAVSVLHCATELDFFPVSTHVNSTQHNDATCLRPLQSDSSALHTLDKWIAGKSPNKKSPSPQKPQQQQQKQQKQKQQQQQKQQTGIGQWVRMQQKRGSSEARDDGEAPAKKRRRSS